MIRSVTESLLDRHIPRETRRHLRDSKNDSFLDTIIPQLNHFSSDSHTSPRLPQHSPVQYVKISRSRDTPKSN